MKEKERVGAVQEPDGVARAESEMQGGKVDVSIDIPRRGYVVCKVCGHQNKTSVGLCEMCSNYLFVD